MDDATQHPNYLHVAEAKEEAYRAFMGTPIIYHRQVLGVMIVQQREPRRYDEAEEAFLVTLAAQLAVHISHAESVGALSAVLEGTNALRHDRIYSGVAGSPGIGVGTGVVVYAPFDLDTVPDHTPENIDLEIQLLYDAFASVREDLRLLSERLAPTLPKEEFGSVRCLSAHPG